MSKREVISPEGPMPEGVTLSPAVKKGNMLFIAGTNAAQYDPERGKLWITGDMKTQCEIIYEKIAKILEAAGSSFDDVVMTTDYITTMEGYADTAEVRRRYFKDNFPAATGVVVSYLVQHALIEIDMIAVLD